MKDGSALLLLTILDSSTAKAWSTVFLSTAMKGLWSLPELEDPQLALYKPYKCSQTI